MAALGQFAVIQQSFGRPRQAGRLIFAIAGRSVRLHWFAPCMNDQPEHPHPWWFLTFVLWGGYRDVRADGSVDVVQAPAVRFRRPPHRHTLEAGTRGCWSVVVTGMLT